MYNREVETLKIEHLRRLQSERLTSLCEKLYNTMPFYKMKMREKGISPLDIKRIEDIHKLPFTKKSDLRTHYPFGLFAEPIEKVARIHCSSGSTGKPTVVGYTKRDLDIFSEVVARSLCAAGATPGMFLQNAYGYGLFTGGLGVHYGAEKLGMTVLPISGGNTESQLTCILDFKPRMITCTPSYAQTLAQAFKTKKIAPEDISLKYAVLGAEAWTESIRMDVERGLGVKATNIYGLSEIIGPGVSNEDVNEQSGSYIWEDHFYPEVVDPDTGEPLKNGENGVLVFTTLTKEAMPLIRYWTNDITHIYYDKQGSRTHIKMGPIIGRADDMLIIRGVNVYPTQIEVCFKDIPELLPNYELIVSRDKLMDELTVRVETTEVFIRQANIDPNISCLTDNEKAQALSGKLKSKIKSLTGINCHVRLEREGVIEKSQGGKSKRVIDNRNI